MSGAGPGGYRIDASGMDREAGKLDQAGHDVGAIRKAVEDLPADRWPNDK